MIESARNLAANLREMMLEGRLETVRILLVDANRPICESMLAIVLASQDTMAAAFKGIARSLYELDFPSEYLSYQYCIELEIRLTPLPVRNAIYEIFGLSVRDQLAIVALMSMCEKRRGELEIHLIRAAAEMAQEWEEQHAD